MEGSILSFIIFTILVSIFLIVKFFMERRKGDTRPGSSGTDVKVLTIIFYAVLFVSQFFINYESTKQVCGFYQPATAFFTTAIPWMLIFGSLSLLLLIFPGWKAPFSNTIGYVVTKMVGVESLFREMLIQKGNNKLIAQIYRDPSPLINEFVPGTFDNAVTMINADQSKPILSTNPNNLNKLYNFVLMKDMVSVFTWYILTGGLVASATYSFITNSSCRRSVAYMKQQREKWEAENNEVPVKKEEKVYKIRE